MQLDSMPYFVIIILFVLLCLAKGSFPPKKVGSVVSKEELNDHVKRALLPQLPPHLDTCYILEFVADGVEACKQMEPLVKQLEEDLGTKIRKINIGRRQDFLTLFDVVGGNEGGNLPFFYNRRTAQAICGRTTYSNLLKLGTADRRHIFFDVPVSDDELVDNSRKSSGLMGYIEGIGKSFVKKKTNEMLDKLVTGNET